MSTDADWLRTVLQHPESPHPLATSETFSIAAQFIRAHQTESDSLRSYIRMDDFWRPAYQQLLGGVRDESELKSQLLQLLLCSINGPERDRVITSLPGWKSVSGWLGVSAASLRPAAHGFSGHIGMLSP
jgi:hypothetical protein